VAGAGQPAWAQHPIDKAGRGITNVLTCWIELPKQTHLGTQESNAIVGTGRGLVKGLSLTLLRAGLGVYEAVTFFIPYPGGFASPYEPIALPDYPWE